MSQSTSTVFAETTENILLPTKSKRKKSGARKYTYISIAGVAVAVASWAILTNTGILRENIVPTPQMMAATVIDFFREGYQGVAWYLQIGQSLLRVGTGFVIGTVLGIGLGLVMGNSKTVSAIAQPFIAFLRPIPMIAFVPVVILFFGIGETSKVVLISASVFFQVVMVTAAGVGGVPRTLLLAGKNVGYSGWSFYRRIVIPAAMPTIMTGVRMAAAVAWLLVVAAEMVAAQAGLGYMILDASNFFRIPYVYLGILLIGLIGLVIDTLLAALQRRVVHWEGK